MALDTPKELADYIQAEMDRWTRVAANARPATVQKEADTLASYVSTHADPRLNEVEQIMALAAAINTLAKKSPLATLTAGIVLQRTFQEIQRNAIRNALGLLG